MVLLEIGSKMAKGNKERKQLERDFTDLTGKQTEQPTVLKGDREYLQCLRDYEMVTGMKMCKPKVARRA